MTLVIAQKAGTHSHKVLAAVSYANGQRLVFVDAPWLPLQPSQFGLPSYSATVIAVREVGLANQWAMTWGFPEHVFEWAKAAPVGAKAKHSNRIFTALDPLLLPSGIQCQTDYAKW